MLGITVHGIAILAFFCVLAYERDVGWAEIRLAEVWNC